MQSEHKANLLKLADYLDTLTPEYAATHFKMAYYRAYSKSYSQRVFGMSQDEDGTDGVDWDYMFGPSNPNNPWKAAARIREVVNNHG